MTRIFDRIASKGTTEHPEISSGKRRQVNRFGQHRPRGHVAAIADYWRQKAMGKQEGGYWLYAPAIACPRSHKGQSSVWPRVLIETDRLVP